MRGKHREIGDPELAHGDVDPHARAHPSGQRDVHGFARLGLAFDRDGVFEVEDHEVGAGGRGFGKPVGPVAGDEQRDGHQYERGKPSTCSATYERIRLVEIGAT